MSATAYLLWLNSFINNCNIIYVTAAVVTSVVKPICDQLWRSLYIVYHSHFCGWTDLWSTVEISIYSLLQPLLWLNWSVINCGDIYIWSTTTTSVVELICDQLGRYLYIVYPGHFCGWTDLWSTGEISIYIVYYTHFCGWIDLWSTGEISIYIVYHSHFCGWTDMWSTGEISIYSLLQPLLWLNWSVINWGDIYIWSTTATSVVELICDQLYLNLSKVCCSIVCD